MKTILLLFTFFFTIGVFSQQSNASPYLEVLSENANIPLKESKAKVEISGTIAHVKLTQIYQNKSASAIEAKYVFPMSTQAAVHNMTMKIGERIVNAKIFEKQQAEKVYNDAVKEGKRAAKLDEARPNVFQMKVGNIMPGDEIAIDIYYTEMLVPVNGEYQFVAPGVVGPRFTGESSSNEEAFNTPYTKKGIADTFRFDLQVSINAGMMIQNVSSPSHKINVNYLNDNASFVYLSKSNTNPANRDFILNYSLRGKEIQSGLLLYEHNDEKFFAYVIEPSQKVTMEQLPSREYLFIVDVSGSMNGYPLDVAKELMRNLLCNLQPMDTFNVQLFASSSTIFSESPVFATNTNVENAIRFLSNGQGGGGTELINALNTAYQLPRKDQGSARSMVVITDGYVNVEKEAFQLIGNNLDKSNVFTFGIGSSVNRYIIEGMAKVSNSQSFIATTYEDARKVAEEFKTYIQLPLLTQVKLEAKDFEIYDVQPSSISDVFASRPTMVFGKYKGEAKGKIIVTGYQGRKKIKQVYDVADGDLSKNNKALRYLWARKKIEQLDDYATSFNDDVKEEVISLGLQYNLATRFTSFVAVDEEIVNADGKLKTVKQPLPMPANVENSAVGAAGDISNVSKYAKSFKIEIIDNFKSKTQERQFQLWFKANYSVLIKKALKSNSKLRIEFHENGSIKSVEVWKNENWQEDSQLTNDFKNVETKHSNVIIPTLIEVSF
ncbi:VIT and VWA domain-containing protein [Subsaxibacter sp. CAU 1640]|uniref:VIT and vWA domain-containing protein n=1 Tax=Subsaxibacter sp. CAU 1640 TaxID=2933271 RepID=UPI002004E45D|nr:VIT and VWA domain-containing protein [Subsaxibacter sp. CAU 1640]MCK7589670.1 VIT and VWA domain-containing protein [Subsaxibacter sp. CAU 1640]